MNTGKGKPTVTDMNYVVVKTTPDRFNSIVKHTYDAIPYSQYESEWEKWHDRLYCGILSKDYAIALAAHLNSNSGETFRYNNCTK
jgi:hypothetical protein